jgi:hypothetical protein
MSRWKHWNRALLALSSVVTLLVLGVVTASATGTGAGTLRAAGSQATLLAGITPVKADAAGSVATGPGLGPVQIAIGNTWTLDGDLLARGNVTITCGPFTTVNPASGQVTIVESAGDKVAHANGQLSQLSCDGAAHRNAVTVLASDVPFRPADGVAVVDVSACGVDPTTFQFICQPGHALAKVRITK